MGIYLVWSSEPPLDLEGPWREAREVAPGLVLLDSPETLSVVYHAFKAALPASASLLTTPVEHTPKSRGLARGTTAWLRRRTPRPGSAPLPRLEG